MFKKIINITLLLLLFSVTTGFSVSLHYCCDSLVSVSVNSDATPCCPVENGCCDNQTQYVHLDENLNIPHYDTIQKIESEQILVANVVFNVHDVHDILTTTVLFSDSSPPGDLQTNLAKIQSFLL
jgi:hypothetical protein